jgi:hypothetical protein
LNSIEEKKELYVEAKRDKEKIEIAADGEIKKVYLDDMPDRAAAIGAHLSPKEKRNLLNSSTRTKMSSLGQPKTCKVSIGTSLSMP